jgi:L-arabinose isomerase
MLGITQKHDGAFKFIACEGESCAGPIPPTGNTNTRARFLSDTKSFIRAWVMEGPTHHFALGVGHCAEELRRVAAALGIECAVVGEGIK